MRDFGAVPEQGSALDVAPLLDCALNFAKSHKLRAIYFEYGTYTFNTPPRQIDFARHRDPNAMHSAIRIPGLGFDFQLNVSSLTSNASSPLSAQFSSAKPSPKPLKSWKPWRPPPKSLKTGTLHRPLSATTPPVCLAGAGALSPAKADFPVSLSWYTIPC